MPDRSQPTFDEHAAPFWRGGDFGELRMPRCVACRHWCPLERTRCPQCRSAELAFEPVSGRGSVWSFTVSRYGWGGLEPPYVIAEVELDEQPGLRLLTSVVDCDDVQIGMRVHVRFEPAGDAWVPVFAP